MSQPNITAFNLMCRENLPRNKGSTTLYKECINKFAREQQEISNSTVDVAKANAAHDAGEAAIQEFNDYMKLRNKGHDDD